MKLSEAELKLRTELEVLVHALRAGDKNSETEFLKLLETHLKLIIRSKRNNGKCLDQNDQDELLQTCTIKIWRWARDPAHPEHHFDHPTAFFNTTVNNALIDLLRHNTHHGGDTKLFSEMVRKGSDSKFEDTIKNRESSVHELSFYSLSNEHIDALKFAIKRVNTNHPNMDMGMILTDYFFELEPMSIKKLAHDLNIPESTARTRRSLAKDYLFKIIESEMFFKPPEEKIVLLEALEEYLHYRRPNNKSRISR